LPRKHDARKHDARKAIVVKTGCNMGSRNMGNGYILKRFKNMPYLIMP
jgi:hypothetical protein